MAAARSPPVFQRVWRHIFPPHCQDIPANLLTFSPDGSYFCFLCRAVGTSTLEVWDTNSRTCIVAFPFNLPVPNLQNFSYRCLQTDGDLIALVGCGDLALWSIRARSSVALVPHEKLQLGRICGVDLASGPVFLVRGVIERDLLVDKQSLSFLRTVQLDSDPQLRIFDSVLSSDGSLLVGTASKQAELELIILRVADNSPVARIDIQGYSLSLRFTLDNNYLLGLQRTTVFVYDLRANPPTARGCDLQQDIRRAGLSPSGHHLWAQLHNNITLLKFPDLSFVRTTYPIGGAEFHQVRTLSSVSDDFVLINENLHRLFTPLDGLMHYATEADQVDGTYSRAPLCSPSGEYILVRLVYCGQVGLCLLRQRDKMAELMLALVLAQKRHGGPRLPGGLLKMIYSQFL